MHFLGPETVQCALWVFCEGVGVGESVTWKLLTPHFCWTKFPKEDAKFEMKYPTFSGMYPKIRREISTFCWQVEKSLPQTWPQENSK